MLSIVKADGHYYTVDTELSIETGDFYIQMDGGDGKPIVRKNVSFKEFKEGVLKAGNIFDFFGQNGYYPYQTIGFLHNTERYKIIFSNNPQIPVNLLPKID